MSTVEEKRALLKRLLAQKAAAPTGLQHDAAGRFEPFPLTEMQRAYVVGRMDGVSGGGTSCHLYVETRLPADRLERAEAAWNRLVCHHDMLRAIVSAEGRQVVQATVPHYTFERLDLYSHDGSEAQIQLQSVRDRMISQRLPLDQWPLFEIRATLMPGGEVHLHMDFDLLLSDAAGLMALLKQWSALTLDPSLPLTPLGLCFRDLVLAERGASEADLRWWRERLPELPGRPELPRGPGGPGAFFRIQTGISAPQWERIRQEARRSGLTPAGLLLAAYAEALGREAASRRFTLTLTRFERRADHPDAMAVLGESTTTLLVPIDLRAPTFRERARAVVQALDESLAHGGVNGVSLLREARLPPEAFPCVFTSLVGLGGDRFSTSAIERGLGSRVCSVSATPQVWVDHQVFEDDGALHAFWDVREGALPAGLAPSIAERWAEQLAQLAADAAAWDRPGFRQLRPEDRALRDRVNATDAPPPEGPLHGPWLRAAGTHPRRPAVIAPDRTLSHAELLAATSSVAAALRARGLRPGAAVGVHCPKGWPQIVAALGVVRAGGAYIPLESALPGPRLAAMLEASQAVAALTVGSVPCPEGWPESVPRLDIHALLEAPAPDFTDPEIDPRDLAYVIFTSGSTGVPKGVMIEHRSALNTVLDINARYAVGPGDRVLGLSALGFDLSVWDIFGVLGAGGALVLPPPETSHDPGAWLDLMITHGVTLWNTVPALAEMLIEHAEGSWGLPGRLRLFLLSGDWVPVDLPRRLMAAGGAGTRVVSLGGATEGSIWSIGYDVKEVDPAWTSVPYGFPLLNQRWRVVDEAGEDCPLGVPGELWIGGLGVARGYMGDPQRTAERFLPGPWYRTGDQGRYRPDGSLEFLGRQDDQVKVRGHRIELGEIEASLSRHPAVSAAVAYAPLTGHGRHRHLLAAVVPSSLRAAPGERPPEGWAEAAEGASRFAPEAEELDLARSMSRALPDMNRAAARWTAAALASLGLWGGQPLSVEILKAAGIQPQFERWAERALILLQDEGLLVRRPEGLVPAGPAPDLALPDEVDGRTRRAVALLHRAAGLLPQVLTGARPAADLLFVDGGTEDAAYLYDAWFAGANLQLQAALRAWLEREAAGGVRALEVGAGVGSTTRYLLPLVAAAGGTYVFTDLSAWFFEEARRRFGDVPGFTLARYDLDNPRHELSHDQHDLIIASSVVHVAARLDQALARLRALLRPGGLLLMIEETRFQPVFNLTMGLQTGFDNAADGRAPHPLLDGPRWEDALQRAGFVAARALEAPGTASDVMGIKAVIAVASGAASVSARGLLEHLSAALPPYMVPSEIYLLDALPLSANGKVDRGRLPSPSARSRVGVPPAPGVEASVAAVWADVLGRADIAADDHFFELGGDSLQIISVKRALKEQLGLEVPVAALFEHPTVAALARYLERTPAADPADRVEQRAAAAADARRRRRTQEVR